MSICDPYLIPQILPSECIGNSLDTINTNFQDLKSAACDNLNSVGGLNSGIEGLENRIDNLYSNVPGIAKAWVKFNGTKGDDGLIDDGSNPNIPNRGGSRLISSSYNVISVYKDVTVYPKGVYIINIKPGIFTTSFVVLGTSSEKISSSGNYTWLQPKKIAVSTDPTVESNVVVQVHSHLLNSTNVADPEHVSVVMFSL